ncbi:MAG: hypothetical protein G01um101491_119 [Parcubacteria group bacterium Gr01-1014_91]|nr:MAG: hypothetical protein G01um101491_119 [Parcubacteria group bacterium Gr01-1014_91]
MGIVLITYLLYSRDGVTPTVTVNEEILLNTLEGEKRRMRNKIKKAVDERKRFLKIGARALSCPLFENAIVDVANESDSYVLDINFMNLRDGHYEKALLKLAVAPKPC